MVLLAQLPHLLKKQILFEVMDSTSPPHANGTTSFLGLVEKQVDKLQLCHTDLTDEMYNQFRSWMQLS